MWDPSFEKLLREHLPFIAPGEPLLEHSHLRDLGLDSIGVVELLAALEHDYDVRFSDEELDPKTFEEPGTLWRTLSTKLSNAPDRNS
jgi:acyl carrier protein